MTMVFYDFEFTRKRQRTTPVSLGMVFEEGKKQFYAEFTDYDTTQVDEWLEDNILNNLTLKEKPDGYYNCRDGITEIKGDIKHIVTFMGGLCTWLESLEYQITMASFQSSYDWVLFEELFRKAGVEFPKNVNPFPYDIATLYQECGYNPNYDDFAKEAFLRIEDRSKKHNALYDAQVAKKIYFKLKDKS